MAKSIAAKSSKRFPEDEEGMRGLTLVFFCSMNLGKRYAERLAVAGVQLEFVHDMRYYLRCLESS